MKTTHKTALLLALASAAGCNWNEGLRIENMVGTVVIPEELVMRDYEVDGQVISVADVRAIGPVYVGLFSGAVDAEIIDTFPHPAVGPVFDLSIGVGDAYPYGGVSIGSIRSACLEAIQCRTVSGRHLDWDSMLVWFRDYLDQPIEDWYDEEIETGEELRQICLTAFDFADDRELGLTAFDRNDDDVVDEDDLDFVQREDGAFEAEFTLWQQEYFDNPETVDDPDATNQGFTLWGFMDAPAPGTGYFSTCQQNSQFGERIDQYNQNFDAGAMYRDVLNRPSRYMSAGDVVSGRQDQPGGAGDVGYIYNDIDDMPELFLNFRVLQ